MFVELIFFHPHVAIEKCNTVSMQIEANSRTKKLTIAIPACRNADGYLEEDEEEEEEEAEKDENNVENGQGNGTESSPTGTNSKWNSHYASNSILYGSDGEAMDGGSKSNIQVEQAKGVESAAASAVNIKANRPRRVMFSE